MDSFRDIKVEFNLKKNRYVYLVGGGGKTTLMFRLAHLLRDEGRTVITTTTTKILYPTPHQCRAVVLKESFCPDVGDHPKNGY
ncbi:MAG: hypothetical protein HQM16_14380 [Deltaproteobacteria bacterium]|nr:hypothetical protein [Deltaproteobacteria bacterium]